MVNQWRAIASLWELEARSHLMTTGVGDIGTNYPNRRTGALVTAWRGNAAPGRMVSRRPQHPVAPSLPPVSRTPGDVSLDQVEAILHDLVAGMAPDPVPARGRRPSPQRPACPRR